ncbi:MAG: hypothetical protein HZC38_14660 [Chloroflexi bacterium]|nr:hypothetical protein [Chloroflexota bacterium]
MDYGNILSRAWQVTWKHKVLWIFGIFVALSSGGGSFNSGANWNQGSSGSGGNFPQPDMPPQLREFLNSPALPIAIIALLCLGLIIALAIFLMGVASTGALIGGIDLAESTGAVTFAQAWTIGTSNFLKILGLKIGVGIIGFVAIFAGIICCPLLCLVVPGSIALQVIAEFAAFAIVLDKDGVIESIQKGFNVLKNNFTSVFVLGLILFGIGIAYGLVVAIPVLVAFAPAIIAVMGSTREPNMMLIGATVVMFLCLIPVFIVVGGVYTTWQTAAWQLAYRQWTGSTSSAASAPQEPPTQEPPTLMPA